jgi:hypothetical protein
MLGSSTQASAEVKLMVQSGIGLLIVVRRNSLRPAIVTVVFVSA